MFKKNAIFDSPFKKGVSSGIPKTAYKKISCTRCGKCCVVNSHLPMTNEELETVKTYVRTHNIKPIIYKSKSKIILADTIFMGDFVACPFKSPGGGCLVYSVRPLVCRLYNCKDEDWGIEIEENNYDGKYINRSLSKEIKNWY